MLYTEADLKIDENGHIPYFNLAIIAALTIAFFILYFMLGLALSKVTGYHDDQNIFFGADHLEPFWGWVSCHKGDHPLLLLFVVPITKFLNLFISSEFHSVLAVNALFGSIGTLLAFFCFRQLTHQFGISILLTIFFGFSASKLLFSSIPESYSLSACSIIITYLLFLVCLQHKKIFTGLWIIAGILTIGVVVTDFIQTFICFTVVLFAVERERGIRGIIYALVRYVVAVFLIVLFLNIVQKYFLGGQIFIDPQVYLYETQYLKPLVFSQPILVLKEILKNFFLINIIAPFPEVSIGSAKIPYLSFYNAPLRFPVFGLLGIMIGIILIGRKIFEKRSMPLDGFFLTGIALSIFSNILIHIFFNINELFLYTCNFSFPALLLLLPFQWNKKNKTLNILLVCVVMLMIINNLIVLKKISLL